MGEECASSSNRAGRMALTFGVAVCVIVAHGLSRPGGNLQAKQDQWKPQLEERLRGYPEFGAVVVRANHFDVSLSGSVHSLQDQMAVAALVKSLLPAGQSRFRNEVGVVPPPAALTILHPVKGEARAESRKAKRPVGLPLWLEIGQSGKDFEIRGAVASERQREELVRAMESGGGQVRDQLVVGGAAIVVPAWWRSLVELIGLFVQNSEEGSVQVAGEMIQVSGRMKDSAKKEAFRLKMATLKGLPECELSLAWPEQEVRSIPLADRDSTSFK
jgi:hypothetical protein